jgi:polysaccharide export outer membrane protein
MTFDARERDTLRREACVQARRVAGSPWAAVFGVALLAALGCATPSVAPPPLPSVDTYVVGAPDQLFISILPEPVIERTVVVRPDGMISIDLVGDIIAAGRTVEQIAAEVQGRVARYKRDARVTVSVVAAASRDVTLLGEVARPTSLPLLRTTRVSEAIGQVGGPTFLASKGKIRVIRTTRGETVVLNVDLAGIEQGDLRTNLVLVEGDIVYVPPTWLGRVGYVIQSILFPFQPLFTPAMVAVGASRD